MSDGKVVPIGRKRRSARREITVGGSVDETKLTLAIYGDEALDVDAITTRLGVEPTETQCKGDRRKPRYRPYQKSAWFLRMSAEAPSGLSELLQELLQSVPPPESAVWRELRTTYDVQLRIGIFMDAWNRGFHVDSDLFAKAAHIANTLNFDIYAAGDE